MAFLAVDGLTLQYETPKGMVQAVDNVSFELTAPGTALGVIGETGSGKSSLVMALARILPGNVSTYTGTAVLGGRDIMSLSNDEYRRQVRWREISVVFQGSMNGFNPVLRLWRQIGEPMFPGDNREIRSRVVELLAQVGLPPEVADRYPHELSGGMKQRAAIAMALSLEPALMILDEPTSALDVSVQAQIMNLLKTLKWEKHLSMIFVTHDIALASEISDSLCVMYAGQIREIGPSDRVLQEPKDPYTRELIASMPGLKSETAPRFVRGTPPDPISLPAGCRFRERCSLAFERCGDPPPLAEIAEGHRARCWRAEVSGE